MNTPEIDFLFIFQSFLRDYVGKTPYFSYKGNGSPVVKVNSLTIGLFLILFRLDKIKHTFPISDNPSHTRIQTYPYTEHTFQTINKPLLPEKNWEFVDNLSCRPLWATGSLMDDIVI